MTTSAQIPTLFRADVVIGPYRRVFDKLEFEAIVDMLPATRYFCLAEKSI
jgi:hypothetical protein